VDATPLFVLLGARYYERTADLDFLRSIWPNVEAALEWIDQYGDSDGDGFVEYERQIEHGLVQQGWKDSSDSVFHSDGKLAAGPIALCVVQSYVYAAKVGIASVARDLGRPELANRLTADAASLRLQFSEKFWCDELSMFAIALDGEKRPCQVRSSNAGHCLFSGITSEEQSRRIEDQLQSAAFFSGWGIRTLEDGFGVDRRRCRLPRVDHGLKSLVVIGYCLLYNLHEVLRRPLEILEVWHGGMASHGGMAGPTRVPWAFIFPDAPLVAGHQVPRHPSQLYAAGIEGMLVFLVGFAVYGKSSRPGLTTATVLTVYGAGRFIDEFWRQPDLGQPVYWGWMSKGQLLTIPVIIAGLSWLLWYRVLAVEVRNTTSMAGCG